MGKWSDRRKPKDQKVGKSNVGREEVEKILVASLARALVEFLLSYRWKVGRAIQQRSGSSL